MFLLIKSTYKIHGAISVRANDAYLVSEIYTLIGSQHLVLDCERIPFDRQCDTWLRIYN